MTTGPDNLGNGVAKTEDRFAGQLGYRPRGALDGGSLPAGRPTNGATRNGSTLNGSSLSNPLDPGPLDPGPLSRPLDGGGLPGLADNPIASTLTEPRLADPDPSESDLSFRDPANLISSDSWLESAGKDVVDHPLLRGLLLELPPKGSTMQVQWLDRWFEAARSILELLYRFEGKRD